MVSNQTPDPENDALAFGPGSRAEYIVRTCGEIIVRPDAVEESPPAAGTPPFKGLLPFTHGDAALFYGREAVTRRLARHLQEAHFLALVGASGSGKTSLIGAGLTPLLRRQKWLVHTFTPTAHPVHKLAATLLDADPTLASKEQLISALVVNPRALPLAANKVVSRQNARRLLLVVDQFEELFTLCEDEAERRAFLETLLAAAAEKGATTILISVQASFYDHCLQYNGLRAVLAGSQVPLAPLAGENLLRAIAEPARRGDWYFVEGLIEHFLENARRGPSRLPLISQALLETWKRRQGRVMTFAGYRAAGGVEGAIAHAAEETLQTVPPGQVELVKNLFISLAALGDGAPHRQRSATITELTRLGRAAEVASVLARLARARLLTLDGPRVRIAHEALITHWPRLHNWLADERERLRFERQVLHDAQTWEALEYNPGALYRGSRLIHARAWREDSQVASTLPALAHDFLEASEEWATVEAREQETRQLREQMREEEQQPGAQPVPATAESAPPKTSYRHFRLLVALVLLALLVGVTGGLTQRSIQGARTQTRIARARELAARSANFVPEQPLTALSLAWQAVDETYAADGTITAEAQAALRGALSLPTTVTVLQAHQAAISGVYFNVTGERILTTGLDGSARLWDRQGNELARLEGPGRALVAADFSPVGERILTLSQNGIVNLWDWQGNELLQLNSADSRITVAGFHPTGDRILTGGQDGIVRLWDLQGTQVVAFSAQQAPISVARFHPSGELILSASHATAHLWDLEGDQLAAFEGHTSGITDANFNPEGGRIVTASYDRTARVWDFQGAELAQLAGHEDVVWSAAFGPSGNRIVTAGGDNVARVWDVQGEPLASLIGHESGIAVARFHPAGDRILTVSWDGNARLWDSQGNALALLEGHEGEVSVARLSRAGDYLATAGTGGTLHLWELAPTALPTGWELGRARIAPDEFPTADVEGLTVVPAFPTDETLWAAGRARLLRSPACPDLFDVTTCTGQQP